MACTKNITSSIDNHENDSDDELSDNIKKLTEEIMFDEEQEEKEEEDRKFEEFYRIYTNYTVEEIRIMMEEKKISAPSNLNKVDLIIYYLGESNIQKNWFEESDTKSLTPKFKNYCDTKKKKFLKDIKDLAKDDPIQPIHSFLLLFQPILDIIVKETNRYIKQNKREDESRDFFPKGITEQVIKCYLAVVIIMGSGHVKSIDSVFDVNHMHYMHSVNCIMTRDQYYFLSLNIHFVNNNNKRLISSSKFYKIMEMQDIMNKQFKLYHNLTEYVVVDEGIIPTRNRSMGICGYEKDKPDKWGYKVYQMVDEDGFLYHFKIYVGKGTILKGDYEKVGSAIIGHFVKETEMQDRHHTLIIDNYFTSIGLLKELYDCKIYCIGTFRRKMSVVPAQLLKKGLLKEVGDYIRLYLRGTTISMMIYKDSEQFLFVESKYNSNISAPYISNSGKKMETAPRDIPIALKEYKEKMGAVDLHDREIKDGAFYHHSKKWYFSFFFYILESTIKNSFVNYYHYVSTKIKKDPYRGSLVNSLLGGHSLRSYKANTGISPFSNLENRPRSNTG